MTQVTPSISNGEGMSQAISSLYVLKALLAFAVVVSHSPLLLPWVRIPGFMVELFFSITGYFLYASDLGKVHSRIWSGFSWALITMLRDTCGTCRLCSSGCSSLGDTCGL